VFPLATASIVERRRAFFSTDGCGVAASTVARHPIRVPPRFGRFHENEQHERRKAPARPAPIGERRCPSPRSSVRRVSHGRVNRRATGNVRDGGATTGRKDATPERERANEGRDPAGNPARTDELSIAPRLRAAETNSLSLSLARTLVPRSSRAPFSLAV